MEVWSYRAHQLLDSLLPDGESARVFGSSSGGIVALDLLALYPAAAAARGRARAAEHRSAAGRRPAARDDHGGVRDPPYGGSGGGDGPGSAPVWRNGVGSPVLRPASAAADGGENTRSTPDAQGTQNTPMDIFLGHVLRPFTSHALDLDALKGLSSRLTLGAEHDSRGQLPFRTASLLAELSGSDFVEFPGGHLGVLQHPVAFADRLAEALELLGRGRDQPGAASCIEYFPLTATPVSVNEQLRMLPLWSPPFIQPSTACLALVSPQDMFSADGPAL